MAILSKTAYAVSNCIEWYNYTSGTRKRGKSKIELKII